MQPIPWADLVSSKAELEGVNKHTASEVARLPCNTCPQRVGCDDIDCEIFAEYVALDSNKRSQAKRERKKSPGGRPSAKLEAEEVLEIREWLAEGLGLSEIAAAYGVSPDTVCSIKSRRTWGWLK